MPQNPTRRVHALLANLPADQNLCPKRQHRQLDWILPVTLLLTKTQKLYANRNACWKKTNFTLNQTTAETKKYFMLTRTLAEKGWFVFLPKPLLKKDKPILKTYKANHEHREKKRHSQSEPSQTETPAKNLEADFSDWTKPTWNYANKENAVKRKSRELENLLAKNIDPKHLLEKCHRQSGKYIFMNWKPPRWKMNSTKDETYETKTYLVLLLGWLTVCVTRAGAGGGTPSDWENAEA